jgi:hypothetical protein
MDQWINDYGLLNAKEADINAENAPLWTLEMFLLTRDDQYLEPLLEYIYKCKTFIPGLYNQFPMAVDGIDSFMSPDQLIAFVGALAEANRKKAIQKIWEYLVTHAFTYDNTQPGVTNFDRTMQPAAILFTAVYAGCWWLKPLLSAACMFSCWKADRTTSGSLKAWVMFKSLKMRFTERVCTILIGDYYKSWYEVFKTYFYEEGHPIPEAARDIM